MLAIQASNEHIRKQKEFVALFDDFLNSDTSSSDEEEFHAILAAASIRSKRNRISLYIETVVAKYTDEEFRENFRLSRYAFHYILSKILEVFNGNEDPADIEKQLLAVIWLLATPDSYRSVGSRFGKSKSALSRAFFKIINALSQITPTIIKWPTQIQKNQTRNYFRQKYGDEFNNVVGIIDGTYVPIKVSKELALEYTNRKKFTAMTLQAVCNEKLQFIDCFTGYPSSVNDARICRNSDIYENVRNNPNNYFSDNEIILGDKAYLSFTWIKPPFINRGHLSPQQICYNRKHSSARSAIERSFAHLFRRFRRLQDLNMNRLDWIPATIISCCVLHNICIELNDNVEFYVNEGYEAASANAVFRET